MKEKNKELIKNIGKKSGKEALTALLTVIATEALKAMFDKNKGGN